MLAVWAVRNEAAGCNSYDGDEAGDADVSHGAPDLLDLACGCVFIATEFCKIRIIIVFPTSLTKLA